MTIKLVAIDLDDTLLDSRLRISPRCLQVIRQVQARGVMVTLATGRMYRSALPYANQLQVDTPLITYQGALVKNSRSGEELYFQPVPCDLGVEVMDYFHQAGVHYHCYFDDRLCMEKLSYEGQQYAKLARVKPVIIKNLREAAREKPSPKILAAHYKEELLLDMEKELNTRFGDTLNITRSKSYFLEFMHPLATKGRALEIVARHYGIEKHEVMALGDSYNDLAMIEWAGLGVAMGNAREVVKKAADYVTLSNEDEGVAEALQRFVL
ncbi:MAG TPA: Cof-type HAD-IIB family hydrolase [Syntrophomonadaceae bacterium]|nr:Cof-type HAD-IIB family hydrolase [Syntrophomonadaceae bacterium]